MNIISIFERDLNKLSEELGLYKNPENIWKVTEGIRNSAGNLTLHLTGNLNYFIGTALGHTNYLRDREKEFTDKDVSLETLQSGINEVLETIQKTFSRFSSEDFKNDYPWHVNDIEISIEDMLLRLVTHLNYHLGQINYHRRMIEQ